MPDLNVRSLQRRRRRLRRAALYALALVLAGCGFGFLESLTELVSAKPDRHQLLFSELARQMSLATGTPMIVKEDDETLAAFESEYNRRNRKFGFAAGKVIVPNNGLLQFTYVPGMMDQLGPGLIEISGAQLVRENTRPVIWEDETGTHPLVIWIYSKRESLLACFVYQLLTPDHPLSIRPPRPDPRIIQSLDWNGVVTVHGEVPDVKIFPEHAFLLPLGDLKLENLDRKATEVPNLFVFLHGLPMVTSPGYNETKQPPLPSAGDTIALLRRQVAQSYFRTQRVFRLGILPLGVLGLTVSLWRMRRLRLEFNQSIGKLIPHLMPMKRLGFIAFQTADLEAEMSAAAAEARSIEERVLAARMQKAEIAKLNEELRRYVAESQPAADELASISRAVASGSLSELRSLAAGYRLKQERERQIAREREREIQWLESEFEAVPPIMRLNEAREAWDLYQRAMTLADPRLKLHGLKNARKKLPKNLTAESSD